MIDRPERSDKMLIGYLITFVICGLIYGRLPDEPTNQAHCPICGKERST